MVEEVTMYLDDRNRPHRSKADAVMSNVIHRAFPDVSQEKRWNIRTILRQAQMDRTFRNQLMDLLRMMSDEAQDG